MQLLFLISHDESSRPTEPLIAAIGDWIQRAERLGVRMLGKPLCPPSEATTVAVRDGHTPIKVGPPVPEGEQVCAIELVDCSSQEEAVQLAIDHPMATAATIEVRPVWGALESGHADRK